MPALTLPEDVSPARFAGRRQLLDQLNGQLNAVGDNRQLAGYGIHAQKAIDLLTASATRDAFDIRQEPDSVRERYGRSRFAQSILMARRLVEAGVSLVQVNWTRTRTSRTKAAGIPTPSTMSRSKTLLMPIADQGFTALLQDLSDRGLLDSTLVVWFGEFGRTPRFNSNAGRDHWGAAFRWRWQAAESAEAWCTANRTSMRPNQAMA